MSLWLRAKDTVDAARHQRDPLIPPRRLRFVGNSDFRATGDEFRQHFHRFAALSSGDRVLDVGCGSGRMARVLADELAPPTGSYDGFDVVSDAIAWCRAHYRSATVPFRFAHVDLYHPEYNPSGAGDAETFLFPYDDATFDLTIATSVFTHLLEASAEQYLSETARVLAPGGRLFSSWFVLDGTRPPDAERAMTIFRPTTGAAMIVDVMSPERAVAYPVGWVRERMRRYGLVLEEPYHQGGWTGRPGASSQDILIARRARAG